MATTTTDYIPNTTGVTKVGDIFASQFGYEASFTDFFIVTKVTAKMIGLSQIAAAARWGQGGMEGETYPVFPVRTFGSTRMHKQNKYNCVKIGEYGTASQWNGKVVRIYNHH